VDVSTIGMRHFTNLRLVSNWRETLVGMNDFTISFSCSGTKRTRIQKYRQMEEILEDFTKERNAGNQTEM